MLRDSPPNINSYFTYITYQRKYEFNHNRILTFGTGYSVLTEMIRVIATFWVINHTLSFVFATNCHERKGSMTNKTTWIRIGTDLFAMEITTMEDLGFSRR
jgi:hypothetical protein